MAAEGGGDLQVNAGVAGLAGEQVRDRRPFPGGRHGSVDQGGTAAEDLARVWDAVRQDPADGGRSRSHRSTRLLPSYCSWLMIPPTMASALDGWFISATAWPSWGGGRRPWPRAMKRSSSTGAGRDQARHVHDLNGPPT